MFCVLTDDTAEQAAARSGGEHGNKGVEAAVSLLKMLALRALSDFLMKRVLFLLPLFVWGPTHGFTLSAQHPGWQHVNYEMEIVLDTANHQYDGTMRVVYTNKSPETLDKVFWHLFFNAFQPESMMDVRSRTISDPDRRVGSRIVSLPEDEWDGKTSRLSRSMASPWSLKKMAPLWHCVAQTPSAW